MRARVKHWRWALLGVLLVAGALGLIMLLRSDSKVLTGHSGEVTSVAFLPDGDTLVSGGVDDTLRVWRVADQAMLRVIQAHSGGVSGLAVAPDGQLVATAGDDGSVRLWRVSDGTLVQTLSGHTAAVQGVAFTPDGQLLVSASWDGTIRVWGMRDGALLHTLHAQVGKLKSVAVAPDGQTMVAGGEGGQVQMWSLPDGTSLRILEGSYRVTYSGAPPPNTSVAYSPDGRLLASGTPWCCSALMLWHVQDGSGAGGWGFSPGKPDLRMFLNGDIYLTQAVFAPDSQLLATNQGPEVQLRRVTALEVFQTFTGHKQDVTSLAFAPDGRTLAAASKDGTVRLWPVP